MRYAQIIFGILLLLKGIKHCLALPTVFHHASIGGSAYADGLAAGEKTGTATAALLILTVGVLLCIHGLQNCQRNSTANVQNH